MAISGGPDSLALTALAKSYHYKNINAKIYYVLVDHKIRKNARNTWGGYLQKPGMRHHSYVAQNRSSHLLD